MLNCLSPTRRPVHSNAPRCHLTNYTLYNILLIMGYPTSRYPIGSKQENHTSQPYKL